MNQHSSCLSPLPSPAACGSAGRVDPQALRRALSNFVTGVTAVTTVDRLGRPRGLTANSFTSVSLTPPLVLFCLAGNAGSRDAFQECDSFAINVLNEGQRWISQRFATKDPDKFDQVRWSFGVTGAPVIDGSLCVLECRVHKTFELGDHIVVVGEVLVLESLNGRPLLYGLGGYQSLSSP